MAITQKPQRPIENELVTKSGYRCDMDLDEAKRKLERDGVPGSVIDELVNDRVLHIEEHRGIDKVHTKLRLRF